MQPLHSELGDVGVGVLHLEPGNPVVPPAPPVPVVDGSHVPFVEFLVKPVWHTKSHAEPVQAG